MGYPEGESRAQPFLFPDVIGDYITEGNPVRFIEPQGHEVIVCNDHVPWYPGKYCSEEPEHEGQ